ncbi:MULTISPECIES: glycosyltransferase family 87 protein [Streptomyces]|uniref:Integral membrane protein n=1 Tax=Streptomyces lienomycini TaxID=284035 RepID=A0ABV9X1L1_9ACTN|nr:glycosyltransferase family 87 protein [Streptomyces lienomycini]
MAPAELTVPRTEQRQDRRPGDALRAFGRRHRVPLLATLPTIPLYAVWWAFLATGGGDLAAQEAWADFASRHGDSAYGLFWYGGMHTANYSVISPYLMALVGVRAVTVVSGLAASWLAAVLIVRGGVRRPVWPALLASLALWCDVASGRTTFALGVALGLAAVVPLVRERRLYVAAGCAALATMASPVAGLFVAVVGAAFLLVRDWGRALVLLIPPAAVVGLTTLFFPFTGEQPMQMGRIWSPAVLALAVALLAPRTWRTARWSGAVYALGTVLTYLVASPVGTNVERFAELFAPAVLLAALFAAPPLTAPGIRRLTRGLLAVALAFSVWWVGSKTVDDLKVSTVVPAWAAETDGVVDALERLGADRTRVEVVPARNHREATVLAPHVNMARGWNRQLDVERGRLFYDGSFSAAAYREWLDRWAVGYVVLPLGKPDSPAWAEATLVRNPKLRPAWLEPVWQDAHWQVYRVRDAVPLVSAPGTVVSTSPAELVLRVDRPGPVTVRVAWSPWLRSDGGCLAQEGEFTRLTVDAPGEYRLSSRYGPSPGAGDHC